MFSDSVYMHSTNLGVSNFRSHIEISEALEIVIMQTFLYATLGSCISRMQTHGQATKEQAYIVKVF